jgi:hypothetical protein
MFLLRFLFWSCISNLFLLILFNTRDNINFGTRKCAPNVYFVREIEEQKLFCVWVTYFDSGIVFTSRVLVTNTVVNGVFMPNSNELMVR